MSMWLLGCTHDTEIPYKGCKNCPSKKACKQVERQIKALIQSHANLEQNMAQGQGKVTKEEIEESASKDWDNARDAYSGNRGEE